MSRLLKTAICNSVHYVPWILRDYVRKIPILAGAQRRVLRTFVEGEEFVHKIDAGPGKGLVYPVVLPDDKGVWTGNYEFEFVTALANSVIPGNICFDVGGWRGYCGGAMAVGGASQVVIFEPLPGNISRIQRLIELNPSLAIELVPAAAGQADGEATFVVMDATSMGKLSASPFQREITSELQIQVAVHSIDSWCKVNNSDGPDLIKIDVEGAEMLVLKGAQSILQRKHPRLFIESHSRELTKEISMFLRSLSYTVVAMETGVAPDGKNEPPVCHLAAS